MLMKQNQPKMYITKLYDIINYYIHTAFCSINKSILYTQ